MSINNLFYPNNFDLFCNSITEKNPNNGGTSIINVTTPIPVLSLISTSATITNYSIRNIAQSNPTPELNGTQINYMLDSSDTPFLRKIVTIMIPALNIVSQTAGTGAQAISIYQGNLPVEVRPIFDTNIPCIINQNSNQALCGVCNITTSGNLYIFPQKINGTELWGTSSYGWTGDISITYFTQ
jgi:hypothetical protein